MGESFNCPIAGAVFPVCLSPLHHARRRPPQFAAPFHLDEEHSTGGGWVFLDLDEIVLLQIQLQDRVLDGGEDEANVLRVCKVKSHASTIKS